MAKRSFEMDEICILRPAPVSEYDADCQEYDGALCVIVNELDDDEFEYEVKIHGVQDTVEVRANELEKYHHINIPRK